MITFKFFGQDLELALNAKERQTKTTNLDYALGDNSLGKISLYTEYQKDIHNYFLDIKNLNLKNPKGLLIASYKAKKHSKLNENIKNQIQQNLYNYERLIIFRFERYAEQLKKLQYQSSNDCFSK